MRRLNTKMMFMLCIMVYSFLSCDKFKDSNGYDIEEPVKNLAGSWYITKAVRNGIDITKAMDFSAFRITFNDDNTYTIDNYLPFLVRQDGTWNVNDPQYPTQLLFKEGTSTGSNISLFDYQTVKGERQITLSFSPGCQSNVYSYVLERASNK
ncbi:DUF5004 domain-containing protein [Dysgonomonas termitidis]|uniref:DUF5004 domain-containing protein n=1 Tax=Dysgonomonas termitidis TaxID=1516126 RepID=A0ABV9L2Z9_9BACT